MFFFSRSLRTKVILAALIPGALALTAVAVIAFYAYARMAREVVEQRDTELARVSAERLFKGLLQHVRTLQLTAAEEGIRSLEPESASQGLRAFMGQLYVFDGGVGVYDRLGSPVAVEPFDGGRGTEGFPLASEFAKVKETRRFSISDVFTDSVTSEQVFLMTVPIVGRGTEFNGVVSGLITVNRSRLEAMYVKVLEFNPGKKGFAYLVDGNGQVVHHRHTSFVGSNLADYEPVARAIEGEQGALVTEDADGDTVISGFAPVPGTSWGIITQERWSNVGGGALETMASCYWCYCWWEEWRRPGPCSCSLDVA